MNMDKSLGIASLIAFIPVGILMYVFSVLIRMLDMNPLLIYVGLYMFQPLFMLFSGRYFGEIAIYNAGKERLIVCGICVAISSISFVVSGLAYQMLYIISMIASLILFNWGYRVGSPTDNRAPKSNRTLRDKRILPKRNKKSKVKPPPFPPVQDEPYPSSFVPNDNDFTLELDMSDTGAFPDRRSRDIR